MPLTLSVGLTRKIGQPDYGSLAASCSVEMELPASLIADDLEGFHRQVRNAYAACRQAIQDELTRQQQGQGVANGNGQASHTILSLAAQETKEVGLLEADWAIMPNEEIRIGSLTHREVKFTTYRADDGSVGIRQSWW